MQRRSWHCDTQTTKRWDDADHNNDNIHSSGRCSRYTSPNSSLMISLQDRIRYLVAVGRCRGYSGGQLRIVSLVGYLCTLAIRTPYFALDIEFRCVYVCVHVYKCVRYPQTGFRACPVRTVRSRLTITLPLLVQPPLLLALWWPHVK